MNFLDKIEKYNLPQMGWTRLPIPPITKEDRKKYNSSSKDSNSKFLSKICQKGFEEKLKNGIIPKEKYKEYIDRCEIELNTIEELYFTDYILLIWKIIDKSKEMDIFIDWGRGSAAGSIVCWFCGITGVDPLKYNLFFSRFLSKARANSKIINNEVWISNELAPDIDLNEADKVEDIVKWLQEIYPNRISKIATASTLTGKVLIKDVYKTYEEASEDSSKEVSDMIERRFGVVQDIEDIYKGKKDDNGKIIVEVNEQFKKWANEHKETYEIALNLRNLSINIGSHASGYLVSFEDLSEHTPLILDKERNIMSAYLMDNVQCIKVDLLGLDTNKLVGEILKNIPEKIDEINLDDNPIIYDQYQNKNLLPYGLYQISSHTALRICNSLKPKNVMEMSHVSAIARPVALPYEKPYLDKNSKCPHPLFEKALNWTNYQPLYQEQTLMCLKAIGFSDEEAERARRVFAKKKIDEVEEQVELVKKKLHQNSLPKDAGDVVIKLAQDGASYQFNLSHSISISYLTALTTYLKYKYPLQFYLACLNDVKESSNAKMSPSEKVNAIRNELKYFNIDLLKPHILKSDLDFKIEGNNIRFSLGAIKNISYKNIENLRKFCQPYSNKWEIFESAQQSGLNITILNTLIGVGAMDDYLNQNRSKTVLEASLYYQLTDREKRYLLESDLGKKFNYDLIETIKYLSKPQLPLDKPFLKPSRLETLRRDYKPYSEIYKINSRNEKIYNYKIEKLCLGYSYSYDLIEILKEVYPQLITIFDVKNAEDNDKVNFGGEIIELNLNKISKNGNKYIAATISDGTEQVNCKLFQKNFEINNELNNNQEFVIGDIVVCEGIKKEGNAVFCEKMIIQKVEIITRVGELKNNKK